MPALQFQDRQWVEFSRPGTLTTEDGIYMASGLDENGAFLPQRVLAVDAVRQGIVEFIPVANLDSLKAK